MKIPSGYLSDVVTRLEANIDDLSPELLGAAMERLLCAGALDVWHTPIQMKKGRPATLLSVLCEEANTQAIADLIFAETSTFGLRIEQVTRLKLDRRFEIVSTPYGEVTIKIGERNGVILQASPEYESCRAQSQATGQPVRAVYDAAKAAWSQSVESKKARA